MDLPGIKVNGYFIPLKRIINIVFHYDRLEIWYDGAEYGKYEIGTYYAKVPNTTLEYDRISKWVQNQDVTSDVIAQLKERIEQLEAKVNELEYSPNPGAKFLAAQEHYASLARGQKE